jgi:acetoacetate decarboxylase
MARKPIIMDRNDVLRLFSTPVNAPACTPGPYQFTNREYLRITYRTDPTALRRKEPGVRGARAQQRRSL